MKTQQLDYTTKLIASRILNASVPARFFVDRATGIFLSGYIPNYSATNSSNRPLFEVVACSKP
jgi:hypothetical protein